MVNVSLDNVCDDVVERADLLFVDDWPLVRGDDRRQLGRLYRAGELRGPDEPRAAGSARTVSGTIGDLLVGTLPVLVNPFGMALLHLALAVEVRAIAASLGIGTTLEP